MAVKKHTPLDYGALNLGGAQFSVFVCDTVAELPNGVAPMQFRKGDLAVTNDTNNLYVASSSTTWKLLGAGSALTPATTVTNGTGFGLAPVVGTDLDYAREDHSHGSVGHDSHTLLSGVSADQHHAELHGSAKHTGGIVAVQEEGAGLGSVATLNIVGAGATAAVVGTVGTVTIPGAATPSVLVTKDTDESLASSTGLQNDNELFFAMAANEVWLVTGSFFVDSLSNLPDLKLGISLPAGATALWDASAGWITQQTGGFDITPGLTQAQTTLVAVSASAANANNPVTCKYRVICGATPGNFQVTWAQNVSNANAMNMRKYSNLVALRLSP